MPVSRFALVDIVIPNAQNMERVLAEFDDR